MKAIIIEDESIAAQALSLLINEIAPDIEIIAILQSIEESVEWFQKHNMPSLVLMDIHLADGSSFAIFEEVKITCPIIFTTAYDEYALKAFEVNSIDYLLKPINKNDLERSIKKFRKFTENQTYNINNLLSQINQGRSEHKSYFLVSERDKLIPLAVENIAYIYIDLKNVKAITHEGKTFYLNQTLDEIMGQLNQRLFFRANRQYIIAHQAIKDISIWFGNKLSVNLKLPAHEKIIISKNRVGEFKTWFSA